MTLKEGFAALAELCLAKAVQMERQVRRGGLKRRLPAWVHQSGKVG